MPHMPSRTPSCGGPTGSTQCTYEGRVPRGRGALADHAQGAHLRAHRRHRGRRHHLAARDAGGQPQLGLPVLLAARRHAHPRVPDARRLLRRGHGLARLAAAGHRRRSRPDADHVRGRRRAPAGRVGDRLASRLRGLGTGADRQRRRRAVPAGRVRRGDVRALRVVRRRPNSPTTRRGSSSWR